MKRILLYLFVCLSFDVFSNPGKERERRIGTEWQKQYMPFTNQETQRPYNFITFSWLAILCGPVVMLESVLKPKNIDFKTIHNDTERNRYQEKNKRGFLYCHENTRLRHEHQVHIPSRR